METILGFAIAVFIVGFIAFDLIAMRWGADSRPSIGDDHQRSI
jgi:uncharacterized membrane protein YuzA (DUF378 family)